MRFTFVADALLLGAVDPGRMLQAPTYTLTPSSAPAGEYEVKSGSTLAFALYLSGSLSMVESDYFLTWDIMAPGDTELIGGGGEIDICINDGTTGTPWNCIYSIQFPPADGATEYSVKTYQKNVAEGDRPSADPQNAVSSEPATPACTVT